MVNNASVIERSPYFRQNRATPKTDRGKRVLLLIRYHAKGGRKSIFRYLNSKPTKFKDAVTSDVVLLIHTFVGKKLLFLWRTTGQY